MTCNRLLRETPGNPIGRVAMTRVAGRWGGAIAAAALAAGPVLGVAAFRQAPADPSPATGDARVIAQGVVDVGPGDLVWQVREAAADPPANAQPVAARTGFLLAADGAMLVEAETGDDQTRLAAGEAMLTRDGDDQVRAALGSNATAYVAIELAPAANVAEGASFTSEPFAADGGRRDLDLVSGSLAAGEVLEAPAGAAPTLLFVTAGAVEVATAAGDFVPLAAGEALTIDGAFSVAALEGGAALVAGVVGPEVPRLGGQAAASPAAGAPAGAIDVVAASPTPADAADEDGDGLTDADEAELNTDPVLADTDGDGLSDGDEVNVYLTLPLIDDTDGDGIFDADEVLAGTDPLAPGTADAAEPAAPAEVTEPAAETVVEEPVPEPVVEEPGPAVEEPVAAVAGDSDGDFLPDVDEAAIGTDPFTPDTDADGLLDGSEVFDLELGPLNPDNDGDGVLDGDEVNNGTDPNDPTSF